MKTSDKIILAVLSLAGAATLCYGVIKFSRKPEVIEPVHLTILHLNDTHSHLKPIRGGSTDGRGGLVERAAYIDSVRHHNGPCFINYAAVPGTEVLTRFDMPDSTKMHGHPAIIAWKQNKWTGRVIPCGSHPEQIPSGENLLLMAAMVRYCFDGVGIAKVKGILHNGEVRRMTCTTQDQKPAYTRIGDRQCHHFVFALPEGARNVRVRCVSLEGYTLSLRLAKETFAFKEDAQYSLENTEAWKEIYFPTLEAGTWYVGVQCESVPTVVDNHGPYGTIYSDTGILNGAPYTVSVSWDY